MYLGIKKQTAIEYENIKGVPDIVIKNHMGMACQLISC